MLVSVGTGLEWPSTARVKGHTAHAMISVEEVLAQACLLQPAK